MLLPFLSYLGGVLTILSPCILPVLPFVFAQSGERRASTPAMLAGLALGFAAVGTLAAVGGAWVVEANEFARLAALALLALFGAALLSPSLATWLTRPVVELGNRLSSRAAPSRVGGSALLGVAVGLLWAPCAGPILGLILTGAALQGASFDASLLLLAYGAGAATSLAVVALAGGRVLAALKRSLGAGEVVRRALGVAVLASVAAIGLGLDTGLLARLSADGTTRIEQALIDVFGAGTLSAAPRPAAGESARPAAFRSDLPVRGAVPPLEGANGWLNSPPLTREALRGKVVLVHFWTYSCINCIRALPYIRAFEERYRDQGLVVVGVHTPEFAFERRIENVRRATSEFRLVHPVAIDNDYRIWRAFRNHYWPAHYLVDANGNIRQQQFGEGGYAETERAIQDLLAEAGRARQAADPVTPAAAGIEAPSDPRAVASPETYVGFARASGFASPEGLRGNAAREYSAGPLRLNQWALAGNWTVGPEAATLNRAGGAITFRFRARDLHLVLGPGSEGRPVRFEVRVDGRAPGAKHGADTDADGRGTITATRLYQLVRLPGGAAERTFEIRFLDAGAEAFAFTFG